MKRLFVLLILVVALTGSSWATWTCEQGAAGCTVTTQRNCTTSASASCNITVTSTHAGAVGILCGNMNAAATTMTGSGGGTWTTSTASHGSDATLIGGVECAYNLNLTGAVTTITATFSASVTGNIAQFFEFTGTGSGFTFDVGNLIDDTVACTSCAAPALTTTTANNYILIQVSYCGTTCTALSQSFTMVAVTGDGFAYKINVASGGTTPTWTQSGSARLIGGAIAIYEVAAATTTNMPPRVM